MAATAAARMAAMAAVRIRPDNPGANNNLGLALARVGRLPEAVGYFEAATRLAPDFQEARENLRRAQAQLRGEPAR